MKYITNPKVTVAPDGKSGSLTFDIIEKDFNQILTTRVSHGYLHRDNHRHPRRIQSSNEAVFVESPYAKAAMSNEVIAEIMAAVEPFTSFPPVLKAGMKPNAVHVISELPVKFQWQMTDDPAPKSKDTPKEAVWNDIAGETNAHLDETKIPKGLFVRLIITNGAGKTISAPHQIK